MAFCQQQRPTSSRQLPVQDAVSTAQDEAAASTGRKRSLVESEEWVLFAPSTAARTHTTSTDRTPRTAGLSRLSDFGSLDTAARSQEDVDDDVTCQGTEEGEELDSLDDGLHAFHEPLHHTLPPRPSQQRDDTVLPTHDGLGTFLPAVGMQEHMWQFERQGTRRRQARRRSSIMRRFEALEDLSEVDQEHDRRQRIERWRMEQSQALLEEIEREARRRQRTSDARAAKSRKDSAQPDGSPCAQGNKTTAINIQSNDADSTADDFSFWQRLTRRVIEDLMGIDEDTLSIIFGEALPEEAELATTQYGIPTSSPSVTDDDVSTEGEAWQHRLLERVARELGILIHQLCEHPGAFSTYKQTHESPAYAGLSSRLATRSSRAASASATASAKSPIQSSTPQTAHNPRDTSIWGIEAELEYTSPLARYDSSHHSTPSTDHLHDTSEKEYWERELDVKMVFNFLVKRFSSTTTSSQRSTYDPAALGRHGSPRSVDDTASAARRAAMIRQQHPLMQRNRDASLPTSSLQFRRREMPSRTLSSPMRNHAQRSTASSRATSHSTRKSIRSGTSGKGGRNFWDMSGSVGSGSVIAGEA